MRTDTSQEALGAATRRSPALADTIAIHERHETVRQRKHRLRARLAESELDALVLTSPEAVDYATGYRSVFGSLHQGYPLAAVVTVERTWLICPAGDVAAAVDAGTDVDDLTVHGTFYFTGAERIGVPDARHRSLAAAVADRLVALGQVRIGAEGWVAETSQVRGALPEVADANAWMLSVRSVKLPAEQQLLRRAANIAEAAIDAALAVAEPGVDERSLARVVAETMIARGGDPRYIVVTTGQRSALGDAPPGTTRCLPGDLLRFDLGCQLDGYWSDIARTAVLVEPTPDQERRYGALLEGLMAEIELARPGVRAGDVFARAVETVERHGLSPYRRHHVGHAIGLSVYEHPVVGPGVDTRIETGGVFSLETPYYEFGWGGMMVEDTGVVTESGFELFTSLDRSLRVVGA
ncbi:M24 family metallopeptidase [Jiangella gansuensis]|uniref:M24 family metallopeptidase n=1 Tax=Jiangella gansuensis TaxID=281473 RepID=UPI00146F9F39|nr:Xaa-Pro peptidase family protein [Jiangella gansuensis]